MRSFRALARDRTCRMTEHLTLALPRETAIDDPRNAWSARRTRSLVARLWWLAPTTLVRYKLNPTKTKHLSKLLNVGLDSVVCWFTQRHEMNLKREILMRTSIDTQAECPRLRQFMQYAYSTIELQKKVQATRPIISRPKDFDKSTTSSSRLEATALVLGRP